MKRLKVYEKINLNNQNEIFEFLISTLKPTIKTFDYFVAWEKINNKMGNVETLLNILNTLIGKENIQEVLQNIIREYPKVVMVIPALLAVRDKDINILNSSNDESFEYKNFQFSLKNSYTENEIDDYVDFFNKTGLLDLFKNKTIKNLVDYVYGIEVGLDSNARKNRSGIAMETLTECLIDKICKKNGYKYIKQATAQKIEQHLGYKIADELVFEENKRTRRRFDFAVYANNKLFLIETNYYGGGGSKLKATAGEYISLYNLIKKHNANDEFIWITDGKGWNTTKRSLRETFDKTDYLLNLKFVQQGVLEEILNG